MNDTTQAAQHAASLAKGQVGKPTHGRTRNLGSFEWRLDDFGTLQVASNYNFSKAKQEGPNTWARILLPSGEANCIKVVLTGSIEDGVRLYVFNETDMTDMESADQFPEFHVPIRYEGENRIMATHMKKGDDRDIVYIRKDGCFVVQEVSIVTRRGIVWVCAQEVYRGQVVVSNLEFAKATMDVTDFYEIGGRAFYVVPHYAENAYPDHDNPASYRSFLKLLPCARQVVEQCFLDDAYVTSDQASIVAWDPQWPEITEKQAKRWKTGVVSYFNLAMGTGEIQTEKGVLVRVHFKDIIDPEGVPIWTKDEEFPVLHPMHGVLVRYKTDEDGKTHISSVKVP